MSNRVVIVSILALFVVNSALWAHSTAGLTRVRLEKAQPEVDDIAFYAERWVGKRADEQGRSGRFMALGFGEPVRQGLRLRVPVRIFDQKTGASWTEVLVFERGSDNTWNHVAEDGGLITPGITTYVKPRPKGFWFLAGGLVVALGLEGLIRARRRWAGHRPRPAQQGSDPA